MPPRAAADTRRPGAAREMLGRFPGAVRERSGSGLTGGKTRCGMRQQQQQLRDAAAAAAAAGCGGARTWPRRVGAWFRREPAQRKPQRHTSLPQRQARHGEMGPLSPRIATSVLKPSCQGRRGLPCARRRDAARGHRVIAARGHRVIAARGHRVIAARGHRVIAAGGSDAYSPWGVKWGTARSI